MTRKRMQALRFSNEMIDDVSTLVELHLRFHGYGTGEWTDSAVRRYVRDAGPLLTRLHKLTRADCTTRNRRRAAGAAARRTTRWSSASPSSRRRRSSRAIRPDLDGRAIMEILGIPPGPGGRRGVPVPARPAAGPRAPEPASPTRRCAPGGRPGQARQAAAGGRQRDRETGAVAPAVRRCEPAYRSRMSRRGADHRPTDASLRTATARATAPPCARRVSTDGAGDGPRARRRSRTVAWRPFTAGRRPARPGGPARPARRTSASQALLPLRHSRMSASPFTFYRGSAVVMANDLGSMPNSGLITQLCGDAHLSNFGMFAAPDRVARLRHQRLRRDQPGPVRVGRPAPGRVVRPGRPRRQAADEADQRARLRPRGRSRTARRWQAYAGMPDLDDLVRPHQRRRAAAVGQAGGHRPASKRIAAGRREGAHPRHAGRRSRR